MKRWPTKLLGEVCELVNGRPFKPQEWEEVGLPIVRIQNLTDRTKPFNYTTQALPEKFKVKRGDTLLSWSGTPGTSFGCFRWDGPEGWLNQHIFNVHLADEVLPAFFIYQVNSKLNELIAKSHGGVGLQHITKGALSSVKVTVPTLAEQERIVKLLDEADELRKLRAQADRRTADLIPALFNEMFGGPAINPFGWPMECVGTLFGVKRGGAKCGPFGSALKKHEYVESGIPVWGIPNVLPNQFVEAGSLFILPSKFEELRAYAVEPGDLLISRAGTVGRICVASPKATDSIIGTNLIRIALDRKRIVPEFFATLMTFWGAEVGRLRANSDEGAYSFMNTTILKALRIYLPPLKLQEEFATRVSEIRAMQAEQAASRRRLDDLFQSMLHRAFNGEL